MKMTNAKRIALCAVLTTVALIFSYVESFVPMPIPGMKLGLANLIPLLLIPTVGLPAAATVSLLRILLEERFGVTPEYVQGLAAEDDDDACLLIGDLALEENERHRFPYGYDLAALWQEWQGLPFVFGAWIISKNALVPELRPVLDRYLERTEESIEKFRRDVPGSLSRWLAKYPVNLPRKVIEDYYGVLDYRFTPERKESLSIFFEIAARMGLTGLANGLEFI